MAKHYEKFNGGSSPHSGRSGDRSHSRDKGRQDNRTDGGDDRHLICGRNAVTEALKSGANIDTIFVTSGGGGSLPKISAMAAERGIPVKQVDDRKLDHMCAGAAHQGCAAMLGCAEYSTIDEIFALAEQKNEPPLIIICDEIEDPHNLGAILRTAEAAGAHGVIIPKRRSASLNYTVHKTSAGAASWVKVARVPNLAAAAEELKKRGVWIYGTDMDGDDIYSADLTGPIALVVGSEGFGMSRLMREKCDFLISLPMFGKINSLNASVAAGICMYEAVRRRR